MDASINCKADIGGRGRSTGTFAAMQFNVLMRRHKTVTGAASDKLNCLECGGQEYTSVCSTTKRV